MAPEADGQLLREGLSPRRKAEVFAALPTRHSPACGRRARHAFDVVSYGGPLNHARPHRARERIPVVWMHNIRGGAVAEIVGVDHAHAGEIVARHLLDTHGCRNMAFVGGFTEADVTHGDRETVHQRLTGVQSVAGEAVHITTDLTPAGAYAAVAAHLRSKGGLPDAIVVGTHGQTSATVRAVVDAGLHIPTDVRVVGFDGTANDYGQFHVTAAQQPVDALTREALNRLLDPPSVGAQSALIPSLRIGNTCGCE